MANPPAALRRTRKRLLLLVCGSPLGRHASRSLPAIVSLTTPILANPLDRPRIRRNWESKPGRLLVESDLAPHPFSQKHSNGKFEGFTLSFLLSNDFQRLRSRARYRCRSSRTDAQAQGK